MAKLGLLALVLTFAGVITATTFSSTDAIAGKACARTTFETSLVADACKKGGQAEAKKVMKKWMKTAKKKDASVDCKTCHTKLAPSYPLKDDGLQRYKDLGGK